MNHQLEWLLVETFLSQRRQAIIFHYSIEIKRHNFSILNPKARRGGGLCRNFRSQPTRKPAEERQLFLFHFRQPAVNGGNPGLSGSALSGATGFFHFQRRDLEVNLVILVCLGNRGAALPSSRTLDLSHSSHERLLLSGELGLMK
jgi:hypothetical protein